MRTFKIINILILIISLILGFLYRELTIAMIWSKLHVNSIIGLQKSIESLYIEEKYDLNIWFNFIVPIINNSIFFILPVLMLLNLIINKIKHK